MATGTPRSTIAREFTARRTRPPSPPNLRLVRAQTRREHAVDRRDVVALEILVAGLVAFGLVMVLSASSVVSVLDYGSPFELFIRQVLWTALGLLAFVLARRTGLERLRRLIVPFLVVTGVLLLAVLAPKIGSASGGSSRWIGAGPIRLQPSEFAKLAFALYAADLLARREHAKDQWREVIRPMLLVLCVLGVLIVRQPDLGTAIVLATIALCALYAAGVHRRVLTALMSAAIAGAGILAIAAPYRRDRLLEFLHPFSNTSTTGYQLAQSLASLASGHGLGAGLGAAVARWFLPNAQTDFIFAVIGNEFGLVGTTLVVACFVGLAIVGLRIAHRAPDRFGAILATVLTCWVVAQAFFNIGGVIGVMPETGIPLPFISFGGSSLVVGLGAMGLLVNIAERGARPRRKVPARATSRRAAR